MKLLPGANSPPPQTTALTFRFSQLWGMSVPPVMLVVDELFNFMGLEAVSDARSACLLFLQSQELGTVSLPAKCRALKRHFKDDKDARSVLHLEVQSAG